VRIAALLLLALTPVAAPAPEFVLQHIRVFDDAGSREDVSVWVKNGKIHAIGAHIQAPPGVPSRLCRGQTLLPGFIDCHVHAELHNPAESLQGGITTMRDLGWQPERIFGRARQCRGSGPWIIAAGGMLCARGGYPSRAGWAPAGTAIQVSSVAEAQSQVDAMVALGAGVIKVTLEPGAGPTLSPGILAAITARAHLRGRKVTAHVSTMPEIEKAIAGGVDELAHFAFDDSRVSAQAMQRMIRRKMAVCPTLGINPSPARLDNLARFQAQGGTVVYGTDLGNGAVRPGIDVPELEWMHRAGMTRAAVIGSATWTAADWLGLRDRGRIRAGLRADLVVVQGDPLRDLRVLARPRLVFYGGRLVGGGQGPDGSQTNSAAWMPPLAKSLAASFSWLGRTDRSTPAKSR
jgi:imidazolonepropionase-like amidohydrolase